MELNKSAEGGQMVLQGGLCMKTFIWSANVGSSSNVFSLFMRRYVAIKSDMLDVQTTGQPNNIMLFPQ